MRSSKYLEVEIDGKTLARATHAVSVEDMGMSSGNAVVFKMLSRTTILQRGYWHDSKIAQSHDPNDLLEMETFAV